MSIENELRYRSMNDVYQILLNENSVSQDEMLAALTNAVNTIACLERQIKSMQANKNNDGRGE